MSKKIEMKGQKFGKLTALKEVGAKNRCITWKCQCDCGKKTIVAGISLRNGNTKSCGCLKIEESKKRSTKHR